MNVNHETQIAYNWLISDKWDKQYWQNRARKIGQHEIGKELQRTYETMYTPVLDGTIHGNLLKNALNQVNWKKIALTLIWEYDNDI